MSKFIGLALLSLLAFVVLRVAFAPTPTIAEADCSFGAYPAPPCYQVPAQCLCQLAALTRPQSTPF
jgi:hypothetical protein